MEALRFAMTGQVPNVDPPEQLAVDPLSLPVVYMNLMRSCVILHHHYNRKCFDTYTPMSVKVGKKPDVIHLVHTRDCDMSICRLGAIIRGEGCGVVFCRECLFTVPVL